MGETTNSFELMIIPILQIGDDMLGEEVWRGALMGNLPGRCLGAVLAKFEHARIGGLCPGTADAHETVGLVLLEQDTRPGERHAVAGEALDHRTEPQPPEAFS